MKNIEYLPNIKVGEKIKLEPEKPKLHPETLLPVLKNCLSQQATKYNELFGLSWLNLDGSVNMSAWPDSDFDLGVNKAQEAQWALEANKNHEQWLQDRELNPAMLTEMSLTVMMQRLLPDRFIIVRSAAYDDYNYGVDQLIIDKETGAVVCGIDEVVNKLGYTGPSIKENKIKQKMLKGGAKVKYGASVHQDKLSLKSMQNIPAFYISLEKEELLLLGESISSEESTEYEFELMKKITNFLKKQAETSLTWNLNYRLQANVRAFLDSLESWPA
ncbi:hypothetical protein JXE04_03090 [Patescibacteria group bacterium]|nr:hypothetical protein [Patescibacteria group bacterium]